MDIIQYGYNRIEWLPFRTLLTINKGSICEWWNVCNVFGWAFGVYQVPVSCVVDVKWKYFVESKMEKYVHPGASRARGRRKNTLTNRTSYLLISSCTNIATKAIAIWNRWHSSVHIVLCPGQTRVFCACCTLIKPIRLVPIYLITAQTWHNTLQCTPHKNGVARRSDAMANHRRQCMTTVTDKRTLTHSFHSELMKRTNDINSLYITILSDVLLLRPATMCFVLVYWVCIVFRTIAANGHSRGARSRHKHARTARCLEVLRFCF